MTVGRLRRVFFVSGAISRSEREVVDARGEGDFTARNGAVVKAARGISVSKPVEIRQHIGPYRTKQRFLADEPTGNLDEATADIVIDIMLRLTKSAQITLLLVTHSSRLAVKLDRRIALSGGKVS